MGFWAAFLGMEDMFPKQILVRMRKGARQRLLVDRSGDIADLRKAIDVRDYDVDSRELAACFMAEQLYFMIK